MESDSLSRELKIPVGEAQLHGQLDLPPAAQGIVVFVHGSGSSRFSPRNQRVAAHLQRNGFATLLFDLLTPAEELLDRESRAYRFDIDLLSRRLVSVIDWLASFQPTSELKVGCFGASTGAAAALIAAARRPDQVAAVVSRGGRPDLAMEVLTEVRAPTLLIIGELDSEVIRLNRKAAAVLGERCEEALVPGATHLFEEGDTLAQAAELAARWFAHHLHDGGPEG
ncbi:dienelactone hydrolase family protein [Gilvimarinus sp. F26214L]|uniref:dienelactone hydrolase family protein n=1 Tax=Gilvimarinus sp. DZF01 TaxID=3461371 RepID=UPI00404628EB